MDKRTIRGKGLAKKTKLPAAIFCKKAQEDIDTELPLINEEIGESIITTTLGVDAEDIDSELNTEPEQNVAHEASLESKTSSHQFTNDYKTIVNSLKQSLTDEDPGEIEELKNVIERIGNVAENYHELEQAMGKMDELQELLLQNELEQGIPRRQLPFGSKQPIASKGVSSIQLLMPEYSQFANLGKNLEELGELIADKVDNKKQEYQFLFDACFDQITDMKEQGYQPIRCVRTQNQKRAWISMITKDKDNFSQAELDVAVTNISNLLLKHKTLIEEHRKWLIDPESNDKPYIKELLNDVSDVIASLNMKIQDVYKFAPGDKKETINNFINQLTTYYHDQIHCGLSGGRSFNPVKPSLKPIQDALSNSRNFGTVYDESEKLEVGIEKINVLHWIADDVINKVYDVKQYVSRDGNGKARKYPTPGHKLTTIINQNKPNKSDQDQYEDSDLSFMLSQLFEARGFRNDIAHSGVIHDPLKMEKTCRQYQQAIQTLCEFGDVSLDKLKIKTSNQEKTNAEVQNLFESLAEKTKYLRFTTGLDRQGLENMYLDKVNRASKYNKNSAKKSLKEVYAELKLAKDPKKSVKNKLDKTINNLKEVDSLLLEALAAPNSYGKKLGISVERLSGMINKSELLRMANEKSGESLRYFKKNPRAFIHRKITQNFAQELFSRSYSEIEKVYVSERQKDSSIEKDQLKKKLFPAAINFHRDKRELENYDKRNLAYVINLITKGLENENK